MRRLTLFLIALVLPLACDYPAEPGPRDVIGLMSLTAINGKALPVQVGTFTITAGGIKLRNDGTFTDTLSFLLPDGPVADSVGGDYIMRADSLILLYAFGRAALPRQDAKITANWYGLPFTYQLKWLR